MIRWGRTTSVLTVASATCPSNASASLTSTSTTYEDANRRVIVKRDQNTPGDGALIQVTKYDQLGRVALTRHLDNAAQNPDDDTTGVKVQTRYLYSGANSYVLISNPYHAATSASASQESTMGWTITTFNQDGAVISEQHFDGSEVPAPWGNNTNSLGGVTTSYDAQTTTVTDAMGHVRTSWTDGLGRLVQVVEDPGDSSHLNYTTLYSYDALSGLACVNQISLGANNSCDTHQPHARSFVYDSLARLGQATNPESGITFYTYYPNGNLYTKKDALGRTTTYAYDPLNRVTQKIYSNGDPAVNYVYDDPNVAFSRGRLTQVTNGVSATNLTAYDALGRVTASSQSTSGYTYSFGYQYNLAGTMTQETLPSGRQLSTSYDGANQASSLNGQFNNVSKNYLTNATYAPHGAPESYLYGNNVNPMFDYNGRLQLYGLWTNMSSGPNSWFFIEDLDWGTSDNNGNLQSASISAGEGSYYGHWVQSFTYDNVNRLLTASDALGEWSLGFYYDPWGNLSVASASNVDLTGMPLYQNGIEPFNAANQLNGAGYNAVGNQTGIGYLSAAYDAENRQTRTVDTTNQAQVTYGYDGQGRRVLKQVLNGPTTLYVYDAAGQLMAEYSSAGASTPPCQTCYLSYDHLSSVRVVSDEAGDVVSRHDYLPFGTERVPLNSTSHWGAPDSTSLRFTGKERDAETHLDFFGARYYGAALGRFTSPDWSAQPTPVPYADFSDPQTLNLYTYARNNPLSTNDPTGHCPPCLFTLVPNQQTIDFTKGYGKGLINAYLNESGTPAALIGAGLRALGVTPQVASNPDQAAGMAAEPTITTGLAMAVGGMSGEVRTGAQVVADAAQAGGRTSGVAAELRVGNQTFTDVSTGGAARTNNSAVQQALDNVPIDQRSAYHGACAEIGCLNQATNAGVNPAGGTMDAVRIRRAGNPNHGTSIPPCSSCKNVMDQMGVQY